MIMDELLEKYLNGEIAKEQFDAELEKLSPEDKVKAEETISSPEFRAKAKAAGDKELERVEGLRKERQRLEKEPPKTDTDYAATLRKENVQKAAQRLFTTFKIPAEDQQHYLDVFGKNDSGHVDTDLIFTDFKRIYAAEHSDELIKIAGEYAQMEQGAEEFNANNGGAAGGSGDGGGDGGKKYDSAVHEWVKESAKKGIKISLEDAKKVLDRGMTRTF